MTDARDVVPKRPGHGTPPSMRRDAAAGGGVVRTKKPRPPPPSVIAVPTNDQALGNSARDSIFHPPLTDRGGSVISVGGTTPVKRNSVTTEKKYVKKVQVSQTNAAAAIIHEQLQMQISNVAHNQQQQQATRHNIVTGKLELYQDVKEVESFFPLGFPSLLNADGLPVSGALVDQIFAELARYISSTVCRSLCLYFEDLARKDNLPPEATEALASNEILLSSLINLQSPCPQSLSLSLFDIYQHVTTVIEFLSTLETAVKNTTAKTSSADGAGKVPVKARGKKTSVEAKKAVDGKRLTDVKRTVETKKTADGTRQTTVKKPRTKKLDPTKSAAAAVAPSAENLTLNGATSSPGSTSSEATPAFIVHPPRPRKRVFRPTAARVMPSTEHNEGLAHAELPKTPPVPQQSKFELPKTPPVRQRSKFELETSALLTPDLSFTPASTCNTNSISVTPTTANRNPAQMPFYGMFSPMIPGQHPNLHMNPNQHLHNYNQLHPQHPMPPSVFPQYPYHQGHHYPRVPHHHFPQNPADAEHFRHNFMNQRTAMKRSASSDETDTLTPYPKRQMMTAPPQQPQQNPPQLPTGPTYLRPLDPACPWTDFNNTNNLQNLNDIMDAYRTSSLEQADWEWMQSLRGPKETWKPIPVASEVMDRFSKNAAAVRRPVNVIIHHGPTPSIGAGIGNFVEWKWQV